MSTAHRVDLFVPNACPHAALACSFRGADRLCERVARCRLGRPAHSANQSAILRGTSSPCRTGRLSATRAAQFRERAPHVPHPAGCEPPPHCGHRTRSLCFRLCQAHRPELDGARLPGRNWWRDSDQLLAARCMVEGGLSRSRREARAVLAGKSFKLQAQHRPAGRPAGRWSAATRGLRPEPGPHRKRQSMFGVPVSLGTASFAMSLPRRPFQRLGAL